MKNMPDVVQLGDFFNYAATHGGALFVEVGHPKYGHGLAVFVANLTPEEHQRLSAYIDSLFTEEGEGEE